MQNRELNTCKQDIYSFLHFLLPTNTEPCKVPVFVFRPVAGSLLFIGRAENGDVRTDIPVFRTAYKQKRAGDRPENKNGNLARFGICR